MRHSPGIGVSPDRRRGGNALDPPAGATPVADATESMAISAPLRAVVDVGFIDRDELPGVPSSGNRALSCGRKSRYPGASRSLRSRLGAGPSPSAQQPSLVRMAHRYSVERTAPGARRVPEGIPGVSPERDVWISSQQLAKPLSWDRWPRRSWDRAERAHARAERFLSLSRTRESRIGRRKDSVCLSSVPVEINDIAPCETLRIAV